MVKMQNCPIIKCVFRVKLQKQRFFCKSVLPAEVLGRGWRCCRYYWYSGTTNCSDSSSSTPVHVPLRKKYKKYLHDFAISRLPSKGLDGRLGVRQGCHLVVNLWICISIALLLFMPFHRFTCRELKNKFLLLLNYLLISVCMSLFLTPFFFLCLSWFRALSWDLWTHYLYIVPFYLLFDF